VIRHAAHLTEAWCYWPCARTVQTTQIAAIYRAHVRTTRLSGSGYFHRSVTVTTAVTFTNRW